MKEIFVAKALVYPGIKGGLHGIGHQHPLNLVMVFMKLVVAVRDYHVYSSSKKSQPGGRHMKIFVHLCFHHP
jgi:hypothetical protein